MMTLMKLTEGVRYLTPSTIRKGITTPCITLPPQLILKVILRKEDNRSLSRWPRQKFDKQLIVMLVLGTIWQQKPE